MKMAFSANCIVTASSCQSLENFLLKNVTK